MHANWMLDKQPEKLGNNFKMYS